MPAKIASSVITTKPDDSVLAKDAYSATPSVTEDKLSLVSITNNAESVVKNMAITPANLGDVIKFDGGSAGIDGGKLAEVLKKNSAAGMAKNGEAGQALNKVANGALKNVDGLDKDTKLLAESLYPGILTSSAATLVDEAGEVYNIYDNADPKTASAITSIANKLLGTQAFGDMVDKTPELALAASVVKTAISLGIPKVIDSLVSKYKRDQSILTQLLKSVRSTIYRSDLPTLNTIMDHIGSEGVLAQVPDACSLLLSMYKFRKNTKGSEYLGLRSELLNTLTRIDSNWDKEMVNGQLKSSIKPFYRISSDATLLLRMVDETYLVQTMIGPTYISSDLYSLARKDFPLMSVW